MNSEYSPPLRVSILARLLPLFSLSMSMFGAALCAIVLTRVLEAMRHAEAAGIGAVAGGMAEANMAITISLYFGIGIGFVGILIMAIRAFTSPTTASPSAWFFAVAGMLAFLPLVLLWEGQSIFLEGIRGGNISLVASNLSLFLRLTIVSAAALILALLVASLVPLPSLLRAKRSWAPVILLVLIELVMIGTAVVFQLRASWLHRASIMEQL